MNIDRIDTREQPPRGLVFLMERIRTTYSRIGSRLGTGSIPAPLAGHPQDAHPLSDATGAVVVPVSEVSELSRAALSTALRMHAGKVVAVHVCRPGSPTRAFTRAWESWHPDVPLVLLDGTEIAPAVLDYLRRDHATASSVIVVLADVEPDVWWHRLLPGGHAAALERALRREPAAVVCRVRVPVRSSTLVRAGSPSRRRSSVA